MRFLKNYQQVWKHVQNIQIQSLTVT